MHSLVTKSGYQDLILDFSRCEGVTPGAMLGVVARAQRYWSEEIDVGLSLPVESDLQRLFLNTNWAHLIDPHGYAQSAYKGYINVPTIRFKNGEEQHLAVSKIMHAVMTALVDYDRNDFRAIEWSLNEVTDNVINHAHSEVGGFVQVFNFPRRRAVEFTVCDMGVGIPNSLRAGTKEAMTDSEALDRAIREGVTRDKQFGQGNGLYGSWRVATVSKGTFEIFSGRSHLFGSPQSGLSIQDSQVPFHGTLVTSHIRYADDLDLTDALVFKGKRHVPTDLIELEYETDEVGNVDFVLNKESGGFGSRQAGEPVRKKLLNLSRLSGIEKITVDFSGIPLVSSSYADEVFGKMFIELGPIEFAQHFTFRNIDPLVRQLIDKAVTQRMRTEPN